MRERIFRPLALGLITVAFLFGAVPNATAALIVQPTSLAAGDQYRLAFLTSTTRDATSTNIADYNTHVTNAANAVTELAGLGTTWTAIASTASTDARDNTGTNPNITAGVLIFLLNDTQLAADYADLWDGSIAVPLNFTELMTTPTPPPLVWTGTAIDGTADSQAPLGNGISATGNSGQTGPTWIRSVVNPNFAQMPLYAVSDILSIPPTNVPEPPTALLLGAGLAALGWARRRMTKRAQIARPGS